MSMAHDWGVTVPADMPTERLSEIHDGLQSGALKVTLPAGAAGHPMFETWQAELKDQMIAAYEKEIRRRQH
jgi:molybdopterin-guanine dinucleotide biosynthesis protein A